MRRLVAFLVLNYLSQCWAQTTLSIPSQTQQQVTSGQSALTLAIPQAPTALNLSVALCSTNSPFPRFFVGNGSAVSNPTTDTAGDEIFLDGGVAFWSGSGPATLYAFPTSGGTGARFFEVALTQDQAIFRRNESAPLFGDSTSTQAIVFSPPFLDAPINEPSYPNYTLPNANLSDASPPPAAPSQTLLLYQTSNISSLVAEFNQSFCGMPLIPGNVVATGKELTKSVVLRDSSGWRTQFIIEGLTPSTNYTAFIIEADGSSVTQPLYFTTKSTSFPCSLVHSLPYCPAVAYSVPLPPPQSPSTTYFPGNLPSDIADPLVSSIGNFSTSLLTFACGRDIYSPLQSCADCQEAYREWACAVSLPRCAESPSNNPTPAPALQASNSTGATRSSNIPPLGKQFTELLPCVETCYQVQRACPSFLGWQCPAYRVNANASYGIGFIDSEKKPLGGFPGAAQDDFGNVFCNMP
ncbi:hypothetical protein DL93DRAFT_2142285 [Clavulina sp. PMI_390]|nr:hypothetical protein DL93DRAFT_2142285 [Clavulina sp. PMI_390]